LPFSKIKGLFELMEIRRIITKKKIDIVHCQGSFVFLQFKKYIKKPLIFNMHGIAEEGFFHRDGNTNEKIKSNFSLFLEKQAVLNADGIISVSQAMEEHWKKRYQKNYGESIIVPCVVNLDLFKYDSSTRNEMREKIAVEVGQPVFVYSGSTVFYQRIDLILSIYEKIFCRLEKSKLLLLISSANKQSVQTLIDQY
jgi:glycosyltransferase involved in cell wall biosynthesis